MLSLDWSGHSVVSLCYHWTGVALCGVSDGGGHLEWGVNNANPQMISDQEFIAPLSLRIECWTLNIHGMVFSCWLANSW